MITTTMPVRDLARHIVQTRQTVHIKSANTWYPVVDVEMSTPIGGAVFHTDEGKFMPYDGEDAVEVRLVETAAQRVARLDAELAAAKADLEQERQMADQVRKEALVNVALDVLSKAMDYEVGHVFEVSDLADLPFEALLGAYESGQMNVVLSRLCERKGFVSAGYKVDEGNASYPYSETVALIVLVPLSEVQPLLDEHMPR